MAVQGAFTVFDWSLLFIGDGSTDLLLPSSSFNLVLTTSAQVLTPDFVGASGNCQYSDLSAELPTASGYTAGGVPLSGVSISRSSSPVVEWDSSLARWSLTGPLTFKYMVIVNLSTPNHNLVGYADMDTSGGSITAIPGVLSIAPAATGWLSYSRA